MVEAATAITGLLLRDLHTAQGDQACVSVRLHKTHLAEDLPGELRTAAQEVALAHGVAPLEDGRQCLVLLSADGLPPLSDGRPLEDRVLPLVPSILDGVPLMPRVLSALGIDIAVAFDPQAVLSRSLQQQPLRAYCQTNLADDELLLPSADHRDALKQLGATTLLAAGGALATGDLFFLSLVAREQVDDRVCDLFRLVAVVVRASLTPFSFTVFAPHD
jgi:hypothetical protein